MMDSRAAENREPIGRTARLVFEFGRRHAGALQAEREIGARVGVGRREQKRGVGQNTGDVRC